MPSLDYINRCQTITNLYLDNRDPDPQDKDHQHPYSTTVIMIYNGLMYNGQGSNFGGNKGQG